MNIPITSIINGQPVTNNVSVPGFAAILSLSEFKDAVDILSTPQILTSDNKEAEIIVGETFPLSGNGSAISSPPIRSSIQLRGRTSVSPSGSHPDNGRGLYQLDLFQEISALQEASESILTSIGPTTTKRSTKTSVVVKDNSTVVIEG